MYKFIRPLGLVFLVVFLDQAFKIWVRTTMFQGQELHVLGNWFLLQFVENNGIAFGLEFGEGYGKLLLSLFRIAAVISLAYIIYRGIKANYKTGLIYSLSLILAGALGNIVDSIFYGKIFGYAPFFHGRVVDMLYFPLFHFDLPKWFPFWGGKDVLFFQYVFNLADSSVFLGVVWILIRSNSFSLLEKPSTKN